MNSLSFRFPPVSSVPVFFIALVLLLVSFPLTTFAAQWQVIPIRLDLNKRTKSGVITVKNTDEENLHVSVVAKQWRQDENGLDQYTESSDLIFFPKVLQVKPNSERVIRVGIKAPAIKQEQAFRLYIKEEAAPTKRTNQVAVAIQFGAPVFVQPLEEQIAGEINDIEISDGKINFSIQNRGNTHFRTTHINVIGKDLAGQEIFNKELKGWYVLAGARQHHETLIPLDVRSELKNIDIKIITDRMELFKNIAYSETPKGSPPTPNE